MTNSIAKEFPVKQGNIGDMEFLDIQKNNQDNLSKALNDIKNRPSEKIRSQIFGIEGMASAEYWQGFRHVIGEDFDFINRSGRGAQDIVKFNVELFLCDSII